MGLTEIFAIHELENESVEKENKQIINGHDEASVRALYLHYFPDKNIESLTYYRGSTESTVVDINNKYIVKLPKKFRGAETLLVEKGAIDLVKGHVKPLLPDIHMLDTVYPLVIYEKLPGEPIKLDSYNNTSTAHKNTLASEIATFMYQLHSVSVDKVRAKQISLKPSWSISTALIVNELGDDSAPPIKALLKQVVRNHELLTVDKRDTVFGHFDLHGANLLVNSDHSRILSVIDFSNCKIGDIHQDFSMLNLTSPDLTSRVINAYQKLAGRKLNNVLVQHYTTIFYLNLLAILKKNGSTDDYQYRLKEFGKWYVYLVEQKAKERINKRNFKSGIPDKWRKWLFTNYVSGSSLEKIKEILVEQGFSDIDIATELMLVKEHPYTSAAKEITRTLEKRNWLLKTYDSLSALDPRYSGQIEVCEAPEFDYFVKNYYSKQLPVVLKGGVDHWPALHKWTPQYFAENYGDAEIEVQTERQKDPLYERNSIKHKAKIKMIEFVNKMLAVKESNDFYMTANNAKANSDSLNGLFEDVGDFAAGYRKQSGKGPDSYLWFGPKGTFTPLHHDLTNNMLVQIYGRKKVSLIPAMQVPYVYNDVGVFSATNYPEQDEKRYPDLIKTTPVEIIIKPGDAIFIPIGWWHCVESLDVSISLSFTDFNQVNAFSSGYPSRFS